MDSKRVLKIVLGIIAAVALIYTIYGTFFKSGPRYGTFGTLTPSTVSTNPLEVELDTIVINLGKGQFNYIKADLSLKTVNKSQKKELKKHKEGIRRLILSLMSRQDGDELATDQGKQVFKELIKDNISDQTGVNIEDIYFRNFILVK